MSSPAARRDRRDERGFTMIEVLVALALVTVLIAAIGSVAASTMHGTRTLEQRVALIETVRLIPASLPRRDELGAGDLGGEVSGHRWQVRTTPYFGEGSVVADSPWIPQHVTLRVKSPSGAIYTLETIRLQKRPQ